MKIRNISNQAIPLRRTDTHGTVIDTIVVAPGDNDVHESWKDAITTSPFAHLMTMKAEGEYTGPTAPKFSEGRQPPTGEPSSPVKHDDMPAGSPPHPGRPHPGETDEDAEAAKKKADEKGPGTRRRDG